MEKKPEWDKTYPRELGTSGQCAQHVLLKFLNSLPDTSIDKIHQGAFTSSTGTSDFFGVHKGAAVYIEVKAEKGKPTPKQIHFIKKKRKCGALAGIAKSINDCIDILEGGTGMEF